MKRGEAKERQPEVTNLIGYLVDLKIRNTTLFYGLNRNLEFLTRVNEKTDQVAKQAYPELFELENKALKLIIPLNEKIQKENDELAKKEKDAEIKTDPKPFLKVTDGLRKLTKEEQEKHKEFMTKYNELLNEDSKCPIFMIKAEVLTDLGVELDFWAVRALSYFLKD